MKISKADVKGYHVFYAVFFSAYFFALYLLLYRSSGFSPFQINIHYFSNVVGSLCKRFMGEAAPYAFLFYLIHYSKRKWLKATLISVFSLMFILNMGMALYYFVTRTNISWYVIRAFQWNLFFGYLHGTVLIILLAFLVSMVGVDIYLYRPKTTSAIPLRRRLLFISVFAGLIYGGNFVPLIYNSNMSLFGSDKLMKMQFRIIDLDESGLANLAEAFRYEYFGPKPDKETLTAEEQNYITSIGLGDKATIPSDFHPKKVVLIVLENVNQSFLSHYNPEIAGATPFIDSLVDKYPHLDAYYPSGTYTLYGLSSLLCSHINTPRMQKESDYECLPNLLKKSGYLTEFIRGFSKYYLHENVFFNKIGFDAITAQEDFDTQFPDFKNESPKLYNTWGFSDNYLFDETINRLKQKRNENLFLTVLTVDTHPTGGRCYRNRTESDYKNDVLFSVNCTDSVLKDFFSKLESEGLFDENLLVILTSDHLYSSYSGIPGDKGWDSFSELPGRLPLVFISKNTVPLAATSGSQVDVAPTLLDILDIEAPQKFLGKSLVANSNNIPLGYDQTFTYMLIGSEFVRLDLGGAGARDVTPTNRAGNYMNVISGKSEELNLQIERLRKEKEDNFNTNSALLKWLRSEW